MSNLESRGYTPEDYVRGWWQQAWDRAASQTESPIEAQMMWALAMEATMYASLAMPDSTGWTAYVDGYSATVVQQYPLVRGDKAYRLDFGIVVRGVDKSVRGRIAVECDGHDFHERTKEQAKRDRKRDRDLQAAGWRVLRFTGSEIYQDSRACAGSVWAQVWAMTEAT